MIRPSAILTAFQNGGLAEVGWRMYQQTRRFTPVVRPVRFNGVPTGRRTRLLDLVVTRAWTPDVRSNLLYESALVAGLRAHVCTGARVVVVGGGHGVTAVVAALAAGPDGHVDVYEAGDEMLPRIGRTLAASDVTGRTDVHHAIVGAAHGVYGDTTASVVPPDALPMCDVLMLDCEGAEREILLGLQHRPRVLLVETHGFLGAPTADIHRLVETLGYAVARSEIAEANLSEMCNRLDVFVLTAFHDA